MAVANELRACRIEELEEDPAAQVAQIEQEVGVWREIFQEIKERHDQYDRKMVREYLRRQRLAEHDVRFLFSPGDKVLLRHVVPGKLNLKVKGPYVFVRYTGPLQVTARITSLDGTGETRLVSAANLL